MDNGLYSVNFRTPIGNGSGVVVLNDGRIEGGDAAIYYKGTYTHENGNFTANVQTGRHSPGAHSVFGRDAVEIDISGKNQGNTATLAGTSPQAPGISFQAALNKIG